MFDQKPEGVEDIFADTDAAPATPGGSGLPSPELPRIVNGGGMFSSKLPWLIAGGAVFVVLIGGGLYLALRGGASVTSPVVTTPSVPVTSEVPALPTPPTQEGTGQTEGVGTPTSAQPSVGATTVIDTDRDGIPDSDEASYGTNPNSPDTDGDELSDADEVRLYRTNPLAPDTDGDGYRDGAEVKGGYNPNGPGKLTDIKR